MLAFDLPLGFEALDAGKVAAGAELQGIDGVWSTEAGHDPYLPLVLAADATLHITIGSAIAVAFARSPLVHAQAAWDLQRLSSGRFILGLGAQVKAHNQRRYSAPFDHPVARLGEMVQAIRAIWDCWQDGTPLNFRGEFYTHTLMTPFFSPGPLPDLARPPIYLAAVTEPMLQMAGKLADGVHVHPLHTERFLDDVVKPALNRAALSVDRPESEVKLVVPVMLATGKTTADVDDAKAAMRAQISFYASTPAYQKVLQLEGRGETGERLQALARAGSWAEMPELIDDEFFGRVCLCATWDDLPAAMLRRYAGRADRIMPYAANDAAPWHEIAAAVRAGSNSA